MKAVALGQCAHDLLVRIVGRATDAAHAPCDDAQSEREQDEEAEGCEGSHAAACDGSSGTGSSALSQSIFLPAA